MKIERINQLVLCTSCVCFTLQAVGYLAPAWFIGEIPYRPERRGFRADGHYFESPLMESTESADPHDNGKDNEMGDSRMSGSAPEPLPTKLIQLTTQKNDKYSQDETKGYHQKTTPRIVDEKETTKRPMKPMLPTSKPRGRRSDYTSVSPKPPSKPNILEKPTSKDNTIAEHPKISTTMEKAETAENTNNNAQDHAHDEHSMAGEEKHEINGQHEKKTHVYLSVGLWYGRLCANSRRRGSNMDDGEPGTEWCTLYIRTNVSSLDRPDQMFELRIEASLGIGFSLVGLLIAGTACCCHHHSILRLVLSVGSLFISGAVMAVPVVHTILQHSVEHSKLLRMRNWDYLLINTHAQHDLFDHWSVILCGVASLISIIATFVFTILACRGQLQPNRYKLGKAELPEQTGNSKINLSWIGNGKVTLPPESSTSDMDQTQESDLDTESVKVDKVKLACSVRDGGDSTSVDSFEEVTEMTSTKQEIDDSDIEYNVINEDNGPDSQDTFVNEDLQYVE